jgi:hypothetical protein
VPLKSDIPELATKTQPSELREEFLDLDSKNGMTRYWARLTEIYVHVDVVDLRDAEKPILERVLWIVDPRREVTVPVVLQDPGREHRTPIYSVTALHTADAKGDKGKQLGIAGRFAFSYRYTIERGDSDR